MASLDHTRVAALASTVDDHAGRAAELAEQLAAGGDDTVAAVLYEAERSLRMASRTLERAVAALRDAP